MNLTYLQPNEENTIMFHTLKLLRAIREIGSLEVFNLTQKMDNLSLDDKNTSSGSGSETMKLSTTGQILERYKRYCNHSDFTRELMDKTMSPFMDLPKTLMDLTSNSAHSLLSLGFRFMPGQGSFLFKNLELPETKDSLKGFRENLGLSLARDSLTNRGLLKFHGFSEIHAKGTLMMNRVLLEAITYTNGFYGRFLILVQIGIGCTVWYGFTPGDGVIIPLESLQSLFAPIENYMPFFYNPDVYVHPGFEKMSLAENSSNTIPALSTAYSDEKPFMDIKIPHHDVRHIGGLALGLAVVVLLSVGLSPIAE